MPPLPRPAPGWTIPGVARGIPTPATAGILGERGREKTDSVRNRRRGSSRAAIRRHRHSRRHPRPKRLQANPRRNSTPFPGAATPTHATPTHSTSSPSCSARSWAATIPRHAPTPDCCHGTVPVSNVCIATPAGTLGRQAACWTGGHMQSAAYMCRFATQARRTPRCKRRCAVTGRDR